MNLKEVIKEAVVNFAENCYGESEDNASYDLEALTSSVYNDVLAFILKCKDIV